VHIEHTALIVETYDDAIRDASEPVGNDDHRGIDAGPVNMGRVQASAKKNGGIEILGPPPFSSVAQA